MDQASTEKNKAKIYNLLALVEDIVAEFYGESDENSFKDKPAYRILVTQYQLAHEYLERYKQVVLAFINYFNLTIDDLVYPEEVLTWYFSNRKYRDREVNIFDFNQIHAKYLYKKIKDAKSTNNQRGRALEQFIAYILFCQTNFEVSCNLRGIKDETDLRLRNYNSNDPFINELGRYLLVEAKNTASPIDIQKVNDFITNVRSGDCSSGLLFSLKGVSGETQNKFGLYALRQAYHKDKIIVLLFKEEDIIDLLEGVNFTDLMLEKYEELRFDG